jgi:4-hydroxy-3-methylbut-2-enyl diphosphate reductase IspH
VDAKNEVVAVDWLGPGPLAVGLTSGASTPDNLVEQVIRRLDLLANG